MDAVDNYEAYLEKYCKTYRISKAEAEKHALVKEVKKQYESKDDAIKTVGWKENDI